ncbi:MAG: hypothetical protein ACK53E_24365, partial [Pseudanabaena sp.]
MNNAVHLNRFTDSAKLRHYAKRIVNAGIFFFIDGEYHAAHKTWHTIKNFAKTNSDQEISQILIQVADFWDEYTVLKDRDGIDVICGKLYREFETDYKVCFEINDFGKKLEELTAEISCKDKIRNFVIKSSKDDLRNAVSYINSSPFQGLYNTCQNLINTGVLTVSSSDSALTILENRKQEIEQIYQNLLQLKLRPDLSLQELPLLMSEMDNYRRSQEDLDSPLFTSILGTYPKSELFSLE